MKGRSAEKIVLRGFDDLLGVGETETEKITSVPLDLLRDFKDHPFRVADDEKMRETVESVKKYGVLTPGIVRPRPEGGYEIVSGHRRRRACELAGLTEMPVIIRDMDDDESTILMVDTNIQREEILPSEKARAYKMKYEAMKHQGSRGEKHTADEVGEAAGESGRTVQRYIRLAELVPELMAYVDENRIPLAAGEKLSHLKRGEQDMVVRAIGTGGVFPTAAQAEELKRAGEAGELTADGVYAVLLKKEPANTCVTIPARKIRDYFPPAYTREQVENVIFGLLEEWKRSGGKEADADG